MLGGLIFRSVSRIARLQSSVSTSQVTWLEVTNLPSFGTVDLLQDEVVMVFQPLSNAAVETKALLTISGP